VQQTDDERTASSEIPTSESRVKAVRAGFAQGGVEQGGVEQGGVKQGGVEQGGVEQGGVEQGGVEPVDVAPGGAWLGSAELAAARGGPPFTAHLDGSAVLVFSGADARGFLHGQLANEVSALPVAGCGRSLLLNHKGHAMAEATVLRTATSLLCVVDDDKLAWVKDTLERHIVFDDVKVSQPTATVLTLQGARSAEVLAAAGLQAPAGDGYAESPAALEGWTVLAYPNRRSEAGGFDLVILAGTAEARGAAPLGAGDLAAALLTRLARAGAVEVGLAELAVARVAAGIATAGGEGGDGVLPQESGLTSLISYRKGCYLGQEIMARIEARGNLRRELATIQLSGVPVMPVAAAGTGAADAKARSGQRAITAGGKTVGLLGTAARLPDGSVRALCVLRRDIGAEIELSVGGEVGRRLTMSAPIMPL